MTPLITYCTACKNRLRHLDGTYFHNINSQSNLPANFVLVNYASNDEMNQWYLENQYRMQHVTYVELINDGEDPYFVHSHAKNLAHKYATGSIVCNVDADSIIVAGFTEFILRHLNCEERRILAPREKAFYGRIAIRKKFFDELGGYDERYRFHASWEDSDFILRAIDRGFERLQIPDSFYVSLTHPPEEKFNNVMVKNSLGFEVHSELLANRPMSSANPHGYGQAHVYVTKYNFSAGKFETREEGRRT